MQIAQILLRVGCPACRILHFKLQASRLRIMYHDALLPTRNMQPIYKSDASAEHVPVEYVKD